MRVTNRMMTNNMLYNINNNKNAMSNLEMQYSTGKKIQRPSEDPIIAVRALKLRTNLSELNQYYEKNIPDAIAWMDSTESALKVANDIITQVHTYCVQGSTDTLTEKDRNSIAETLQELKQQIYQEGNTNYAGRNVFTGYKTDSSLVFDAGETKYNYKITEPLKGSNIDIIKKTIHSYDLDVYDPENPGEADFSQKPSMVSSYRLRLAYDSLKKIEEDGTIRISFPEIDQDGNYVYDEDGVLQEEEFSDTIEAKLSTDPNVYQPEPGEVYFIQDTGELIMGEEVYQDWKERPSIHVEYEKETFEKNDLRPEHYFNCTVSEISNNTGEIDEDKEPIVYTKQDQQIKYEINFNQTLLVNTQGSDAVNHDIGRTIDEILDAINEVSVVEQKMAETEKMLADGNITDTQRETLTQLQEVLKTEYTLKTEVMQTSFEKGMTQMEKQQDVINVALADLGSRYVRLELTESRLSTEQADFVEMLSNNEDADLVDTVIRYNSQETIYNASLNAAAKVVKNTLLDFI